MSSGNGKTLRIGLLDHMGYGNLGMLRPKMLRLQKTSGSACPMRSWLVFRSFPLIRRSGMESRVIPSDHGIPDPQRQEMLQRRR